MGINVYINNPGHITKMSAMPIYGKNPSKTFFSGTGGLINQTWHEPSTTQVLQCIYKSLPCNDLDLFYSRVSFENIGFYMGKSENYGFFGKLLQPET